MKCSIRLWVFLGVLGLVAGSPLSFGQIVNASLTGLVTDPTGAVIPDAGITATDVQTGMATRTTTDASGTYSFLSLRPSTYIVAVEKAGFKSTVLTGFKLLVDQKARVDVQLVV